MSGQRHSGFAQFPDPAKRDEFVRTVLESDAALTSRAHLSATRPTIVFENLSARQQQKVVAALDGLGRWFPDVQFEAMG